MLVANGGYSAPPPAPAPAPAPTPAPPPAHPVIGPPTPPAAPTAPDVRGYSGGWCTAWCATLCPWIPAGLGNADTWPTRAPAHGLQLTQIPTVGAVCCYGDNGGYSSLGHVAVVQTVFTLDSFEVSEMAYVAWDHVDLRTSNMQDVVGFILPPGVSPGQGLPVAPPPPAQGLEGARGSWASLADFLEHGLPATVSQIASAVGSLRSGV